MKTTLAPGAPWPTPAELAAAIAASLKRTADRLASQLKAKKTRNSPRKYQKVKP